MSNPSGAAPKRSKIMTKFILGGATLVLLTVGGMTLYTMASLRWAYSDGDRSGILQKFSRKGWVCKTYEGELAVSYTPGLAPVLWNFSVRDDAVATKINGALGKHVVLHYNEHRGIPTECFGETMYFVDDVRVVP